ncbi:MarR family transcriptional regulator [Microbacterium sp. NPDC097977]|uniref:MarR family winged helix-turn-helix transcriptional regulator n=1 Tax=Microbacterium sp. NPDC097977 TaxID=3155686 RepID=UPI003328D216
MRNGPDASPPGDGASDALVAREGEFAERLSHAALYDVDSSDPRSALIDRSGVDPEDLRQIAQVMGALGELRDAEQKLSLASRRYMRLNDTDMRALHYLIVSENRGGTATPGAIATHLGISTASTTKLLDRLEKGGHIRRAPHPTDRRALAISITAETRRAAMETVGKQQAKRFYSAARLTSEERDVVIRFLSDMAQEIAIRDEPWAQAGVATSE